MSPVAIFAALIGLAVCLEGVLENADGLRSDTSYAVADGAASLAPVAPPLSASYLTSLQMRREEAQQHHKK